MFELPPPRSTPLVRGSGPFARLSKGQRATAEEVLAGAEVFFIVRTGTKTDVGSWLGPGRACACALADELLLFAPKWDPRAGLFWLVTLAGKLGLRMPPYVERIPFGELRRSSYNHVTGELVLAPAEGVRVRRLKMSPLDGYQLLAQVCHGKRGPQDA